MKGLGEKNYLIHLSIEFADKAYDMSKVKYKNKEGSESVDERNVISISSIYDKKKK